mmetsp:Transcript_15523/g.28552  ORF Transcript_15523/g.28552 Transcript_15523/m.28552 type:complete len:234 (-) Transcript_15523:1500-2201(-)
MPQETEKCDAWFLFRHPPELPLVLLYELIPLVKTDPMRFLVFNCKCNCLQRRALRHTNACNLDVTTQLIPPFFLEAGAAAMLPLQILHDVLHPLVANCKFSPKGHNKSASQITSMSKPHATSPRQTIDDFLNDITRPGVENLVQHVFITWHHQGLLDWKLALLTAFLTHDLPLRLEVICTTLQFLLHCMQLSFSQKGSFRLLKITPLTSHDAAHRMGANVLGNSRPFFIDDNL